MGEFLAQTMVANGKKASHPMTKKVLGHDIIMVKVVRHLIATKSRTAEMKTPGGLPINDVINEVIEYPCKLISYMVL